MRTTILICTPDSRSDTFKRCYESLQATTRGIPYDLIVRDNRWNPKFNHAEEIVRTMSSAPEGDFITLDDDVELVGTWLEAMLENSEKSMVRGIVATTEYKPNNLLWRRGWYCDKHGKPIKWTGEIKKQKCVPAVSSCCMLITERAKNHIIELDYSTYKKYYFDIEWCFECWINDLSVSVIQEHCIHHGGVAVNKSGLDVSEILEHDRRMFIRRWIESGKLKNIQDDYSCLFPMEFEL
jgi:GT2 family glycosyltransferase